MSQDEDRRFFERAFGLALVASLAAACLTVTAPFVVPLLWGVIIAVSTWPLYRRVRDALHGHPKTAATLTATAVLVVTVTPLVVLTLSLVDNARAVAELVGDLGGGSPDLPPPPAWLARVPVVGSVADGLWREATANVGPLLAQARPYIARLTGWLLARGADLGLVAIEFLVSIAITGILYVTGEPAVALLRRLVARIGSEDQVGLVDLAGRTIRGVAVGVIGTALVQGVLAAGGLVVAGAPAPVLLAFAVFMAAVLQLPTATVLLPVAGWLFWAGLTWQPVFLAVWSLTVVNTVDNVVRPYLISQGADLPFLLILVGVVGGLLTWGFIGIFLGATLLAVGYTLFLDWLDDDHHRRGWPKPSAADAAPAVAVAAAAAAPAPAERGEAR